MGMTTVLNAAGVDKDRFVDYTEKNPATYKVRLCRSILFLQWIIDVSNITDQGLLNLLTFDCIYQRGMS